MNKRNALRLAAVVVVLGALALLIPGSPIYVLKFLSSSGHYGGHTTRYWINSLDNADPEVRREAIHSLGAIGADAEEAVPALARTMLEDSDRGARIEASLALMKMGPKAAAAVPALAQALGQKDPFVRMNAAMALMRMREEARPTIPALIKGLKDRDNDTNLDTFALTVREMMALALGAVSSGTGEGVPALMAALEEADTQEMRRSAIRALGSVGPAARLAIPRLRAMLHDNSAEVRETAEEALLKVDGASNENKVAAGVDPANMELPQAERTYLWEIEHHGNLLMKHGFGPLAEALKHADAAALSRLLADDFDGSDLGEPRRVKAGTGDAEVERLEDAGHRRVPLSQAAFVARLLELRQVFTDTPPQVKFALMTLSLRQRGQMDGAWVGTAQLRLFGEHVKNAPAEVVIQMRFEVTRPTEEALSRPGWLHSAGITQVQTAKASHYLFAEVGRQRGLDPSKLHDNWKTDDLQTTPGGVYVCDFDRDGILDVLVTDITGNTLYRGRRDGTFEDVTERYGVPRHTQGTTVAAWVDIDGDGWEDLLLAGRVFRNEQGQRFTEYTQRCNLHLPNRVTGIVVADYDRDGKLDLYVTRSGQPAGQSWISGKSSDSDGNHLYRNKGNWQFEDVTRASGTFAEHRSSFTAAWLDANNDGWPDLHVINEFGDGVLLINNGNGTFTSHALSDRPADFGSMGLAVGDIDNDGNIDIYCANMYSKAGSRVIANLAPDAYSVATMEKMRRFVGGSQLHLNKGRLQFQQVGQRMQVASVGWAYGTCLADLDNDGWLDIYATCGFVSRSRDDPDG